MNRSILTIAASLAVITTILSTAPTITGETTAYAAESRYTATFKTAEPEKVIVPGGSTSADLPNTVTWGFSSWLFMYVSVPVFPTDEVELEADVIAGDYVPVLTFTPNPGWEIVEEYLKDGVLHTVYFYNEPVKAGADYTPLFDTWSMTNFKVHNGQCGNHTYAEIIEKVNESGMDRYSLQSDGINGTPYPQASASSWGSAPQTG